MTDLLTQKRTSWALMVGSDPALNTSVPLDYWAARLATLKAKVDAAARRPTPMPPSSCIPGAAAMHTSHSSVTGRCALGYSGSQAAQAEPWRCASASCPSHLAPFATVIPPQPPPDAPFTFTEVSAMSSMPAACPPFPPSIIGLQGLTPHASSAAMLPTLADFQHGPGADGLIHAPSHHAAKRPWAPAAPAGGLVDANLGASAAAGQAATLKRQRSASAHAPQSGVAMNGVATGQRHLPPQLPVPEDTHQSSSANLLMSLSSAASSGAGQRAAYPTSQGAAGQFGMMRAAGQAHRGDDGGRGAAYAARSAGYNGAGSNGTGSSHDGGNAAGASNGSGRGQRANKQADRAVHGNASASGGTTPFESHARACAAAGGGPFPMPPSGVGPYPVELPTISSSPATPMNGLVNGAIPPYPVDRGSPILDVLPPAIVMSRNISGMSALDGDIGDIRGIAGDMSTSRMASLFDATPEVVEEREAVAEILGVCGMQRSS